MLFKNAKRWQRESVDDSLTNLQWLTEANLADILDRTPKQHDNPPSPTTSSDDGDNNHRVGENRSYLSLSSSSTKRKARDEKPPYSYAALIVMALHSKASGKMTLSEIYKWITENFPFYRNADPTWKNAIRHNLSLNKSFVRIPRKKGESGKGGYWSIVPEFGNKLLLKNMRKRSSYSYECDRKVNKRQYVHTPDTQLLKRESCIADENLAKIFLNQITVPCSDQQTTVEVLAESQQTALQFPYDRNGLMSYGDSDAGNILALASHLKETTSSFPSFVNMDENILIPTRNSIVSNFPNLYEDDCMWSTGYNTMTDSMLKVTRDTDALLNSHSNSSTDSISSFFRFNEICQSHDAGRNSDSVDLDEIYFQ